MASALVTQSKPAGNPSEKPAGTVLGLLFPQLAQKFMRNRAPTLRDRLQIFITKKLYPDGFAVRGNWVAIDYVTEALTRHGTLNRYQMFVEPGLVDLTRKLIESSPPLGPGREIHVSSMLELAGVDRFHFTAFLNPTGGFPQPLIVRNRFSSNLYPVTFLSHGFSLHNMLFDGFLRLILDGTYPCDSIICTSRAARAAMANILRYLSDRFLREYGVSVEYSGRLDVIPLCIDTGKFQPREKPPLRKQFRIPKDATVLLYLGYISPLKADLLPLLQVFRQLIRDNPKRQLLLVIAGSMDATYAPALEAYIQEFGLAKHVRIMEGLSDTEKSALTAASDIFVSPGDSIQESFGLTPIEAMACGIPQVVADWDGYRDTVSHGETGFLVPTYWAKCDSDLAHTGHLMGWDYDHLAIAQSIAIDLAKMREYLQLLIDNEPLREEMSRRSRARAEALYSFPALAARYEELWAELTEIAGQHRLDGRGVNFDSPDYFGCFRGHATGVIGDDAVLSLTPEGRAANLEILMHARLTGFQTIDPGLARSALDRLMAGDVRFGELAEAHREGRHADFVRRNILWLVKNGFLRPVA